MDADLLAELRNALQSQPQLQLLPDAEAQSILRDVAQRFGCRPDAAWWWQQLSSPVRSFEYGGADGLSILDASLPANSADTFLFLTDDSPPPWPCIRGSGPLLVELLRELRFVECFLVDAGLHWILFDTHLNSVIGAGDGLRIPTNQLADPKP